MDALHYFGILGLRRGFKKDSLVFDVGLRNGGTFTIFNTFTIYNLQFTIYSDIMFQVGGLRRLERDKGWKGFLFDPRPSPE